jgi:hypothetical protein
MPISKANLRGKTHEKRLDSLSDAALFLSNPDSRRPSKNCSLLLEFIALQGWKRAVYREVQGKECKIPIPKMDDVSQPASDYGLICQPGRGFRS